MSDDLTPSEARARDAVRSLAPPVADPAFRARLKREFVAGSLASRFGDAATEPAAEDLVGMQAAPARREGRVVRGPWRTWAQPLAWAAAAAIVAATGVALNRGPAWRVSGVAGSGIAVVDDRPIPLEHVDQLSRSLHAGARIQVPPGAQLEVAIPGTIMIESTGGSEMVLPRSPGRWFGRDAAAEIRHGELRITTGAGFHGSRLAVTTPEARIDVTGTTLAVICEPQGTCVCVLDGRVQVGTPNGAMEPVTGGRRRYVFNDGRAPEMADMREEERTALGTFRDRIVKP